MQIPYMSKLISAPIIHKLKVLMAFGAVALCSQLDVLVDLCE